MFGLNYEAPLIEAPPGDDLPVAPNILTDIASRHLTGARRPCIAAAASVAIHGLLLTTLILVPAYAFPSRFQETRKPHLVTMLGSPYPGILASHMQNPRIGARPQSVAAANPLLREAAQMAVKIEAGVFDNSFRDTLPIPAHTASRYVVVGKFDGEGGNSDGPAAPVVTVGPVGALDSFGPAPLVSPQLLTVPTPVYSEEAKRFNVTGQVVLVVKLAASGSIRYISTVSGLGHGLDEAAIAAVNQGRCQPATRAGIPVDMYGTITVTFRLT